MNLRELLIGSGLVGLGPRATERKPGESEAEYELRQRRNEQSRRAKAKAQDQPAAAGVHPFLDQRLRAAQRKEGESEAEYLLRQRLNEQSRRAKAKARGTDPFVAPAPTIPPPPPARDTNAELLKLASTIRNRKLRRFLTTLVLPRVRKELAKSKPLPAVPTMDVVEWKGQQYYISAGYRPYYNAKGEWVVDEPPSLQLWRPVGSYNKEVGWDSYQLVEFAGMNEFAGMYDMLTGNEWKKYIVKKATEETTRDKYTVIPHKHDFTLSPEERERVERIRGLLSNPPSSSSSSSNAAKQPPPPSPPPPPPRPPTRIIIIGSEEYKQWEAERVKREAAARKSRGEPPIEDEETEAKRELIKLNPAIVKVLKRYAETLGKTFDSKLKKAFRVYITNLSEADFNAKTMERHIRDFLEAPS